MCVLYWAEMWPVWGEVKGLNCASLIMGLEKKKKKWVNWEGWGSSETPQCCSGRLCSDMWYPLSGVSWLSTAQDYKNWRQKASSSRSLLALLVTLSSEEKHQGCLHMAKLLRALTEGFKGCSLTWKMAGLILALSSWLEYLPHKNRNGPQRTFMFPSLIPPPDLNQLPVRDLRPPWIELLVRLLIWGQKAAKHFSMCPEFGHLLSPVFYWLWGAPCWQH